MTLEELVISRLVPKPLDGVVPLGPRRAEVLRVLRDQPGTLKNFSAGARSIEMLRRTFQYHAIQLAQQEVIRIVYFPGYVRHVVCGVSEIVPWKPGSATSKRTTTYRKNRMDPGRRAFYLFEVSWSMKQTDGIWVSGGCPFVD